MDNLARQPEDFLVFHEFGHITGLQEDAFIVDAGSGRYVAKKAVSCLLEPRMGARVLLVGDATGECYILSVLEHGIDKKSSIQFDGDAEVVTRNGRLQIAAQKGIDLATVDNIGLVSSGLNVHSNGAEVSISRLSYRGSSMFAQIGKIKVLAATIESAARRLTQKIKQSYRTVEDLDQVKAGKLEYRAEKLMAFRGKYSMFTAEEDVRIDGERIHLG